MKHLKKKIFAFAITMIVMTMPLISALATSYSNLWTIAGAATGDKAIQTGAAIIDTAVAIGIYTSFLCGVQGLVALGVAG